MSYRKFLSTVFLLYVVLGCWKGHLAVFEGSAEEPRQIYPKKIDALPEDDQEALAEGILIRDPRRLEELLRDYLS